jgi:hypothetical protein
MGNMIRTGGGENETRRHTASGQVSGRQEGKGGATWSAKGSEKDQWD